MQRSALEYAYTLLSVMFDSSQNAAESDRDSLRTKPRDKAYKLYDEDGLYVSTLRRPRT